MELPATGWLRRYRVRAHGHVDAERLERLAEGIIIDGIEYGPIEATLDRVQGDNSWLTVSLREGKNREVKNVLATLGLDVNRLIRVSFGPFQLGEMPESSVEEVKTQVLKDQLGDDLADLAGVDFDHPVFEYSNPRDRRPVRETGRFEDRQTRDRMERPDRFRDNPRFQPRHPEEEEQEESVRRGPPPGSRGRIWRDDEAADIAAHSHKRTYYKGERELPRAKAADDRSPRRMDPIADAKGRRVKVDRVGKPRPVEQDEPRPFRDRFERTPRFDRDERPSGGDRPFRKPFQSRDDRGGERSERPRFDRGDRPAAGGDRPFRKPFQSRDDRGGEHSERPRFDRGDRPAAVGIVPSASPSSRVMTGAASARNVRASTGVNALLVAVTGLSASPSSPAMIAVVSARNVPVSTAMNAVGIARSAPVSSGQRAGVASVPPAPVLTGMSGPLVAVTGPSASPSSPAMTGVAKSAASVPLASRLLVADVLRVARATAAAVPRVGSLPLAGDARQAARALAASPLSVASHAQAGDARPGVKADLRQSHADYRRKIQRSWSGGAQNAGDPPDQRQAA